MKKFGFTLAEVLITLAVVGVVAAMTIPTLVVSYQKQQYVAGLKKAYTQAYQSIINLTTNLGCAGDLKCTNLFSSFTVDADPDSDPDGYDDEFMDKYKQGLQGFGDAFANYFKVLKNCGTASTDCFESVVSYTYDGKVKVGIPLGYSFINQDGTALMVTSWHNDCNDSNFCGELYIDVNGPNKPPNSMGRDIFAYNLGKTHFLWPLPWRDITGAPRYCYPGNTHGESCASRIMEDGWQMNY